MTNTISYYENESRFDVYKTVQSGFVKLLIKKDFKPFKIHVFMPYFDNWILTKPSESYLYYKNVK